MNAYRICAAFVFFGLFAASAASASLISNDIAGAREYGALSSSAVESVRRDSPIVMGRSVSAHHKTKLHHIKMKPLDTIEKPAAPEQGE